VFYQWWLQAAKNLAAVRLGNARGGKSRRSLITVAVWHCSPPGARGVAVAYATVGQSV